MREYEMYGEFKIELLRKFLPYKHGAPSRSTIGKVFVLFNPYELSKVFVGWMKQVVVEAEKEFYNDTALPDSRKPLQKRQNLSQPLYSKKQDRLHTM